MADTKISVLTAGTPGAADTFPFQRGGTATFAASGSSLGAGTILLPYVAPGTSGNVLTSDGTGWTSAAPSRELLTADRTYYVRTDGNDSNTGLVNSAGGAFLTIVYALSVAASLDTSLYNVTIQVGDGTYVENTISIPNLLGSGTLTITGNTGTPSNVVIDGGFSKDKAGTTVIISYMKLIKSSGTATNAISSQFNAVIYWDGIIFGSGFTYHISVVYMGTVLGSGNYTIEGGAVAHWRAQYSGLITVPNRTITLSGTPAFSNSFARIEGLSFLLATGNTYSGSATGSRYVVSQNSVINSGVTLPGDSAGTTATGGQYV